MMMNFCNWFFATPMASTAIISIIIAMSVYTYQKKEKRKHNAYILAEKYAENILPRAREIGTILEAIGATNHIKNVSEFDKFDNNELKSLLNVTGFGIKNYEKLFEQIDRKIITESIIKCGGEKNSNMWYNLIEDEENKSLYFCGFQKYVINFLNELEPFCMLLRYNIAEERLIYQSLHQTFLKHMKNWYFFISKDNQIDDNRYYDNIIWLYEKWSHRKKAQKKKMHKNKSIFRGRKL